MIGKGPNLPNVLQWYASVRESVDANNDSDLLALRQKVKPKKILDDVLVKGMCCGGFVSTCAFSALRNHVSEEIFDSPMTVCAYVCLSGGAYLYGNMPNIIDRSYVWSSINDIMKERAIANPSKSF
jgi:hypothetical protein